jgi:hypothetical protein
VLPNLGSQRGARWGLPDSKASASLFFFSRLRRGSSLRYDLIKKNKKIKKI